MAISTNESEVVAGDDINSINLSLLSSRVVTNSSIDPNTVLLFVFKSLNTVVLSNTPSSPLGPTTSELWPPPTKLSNHSVKVPPNPFNTAAWYAVLPSVVLSGPFSPCIPSGPLSPSGPRSPIGPWSPIGPFSPLGPCGPCGPCAPIGPFSPCGPWGPWIPVSPLRPISPTGPIGPWSPISPFSPLGPFSPCGPCSPVDPFSPCGPLSPSGPFILFCFSNLLFLYV